MGKALIPIMRHYDGVDSMLALLASYGYHPSKWAVRTWLYRFKNIPIRFRWCFCIDLQDRGIYFTAADFERANERVGR